MPPKREDLPVRGTKTAFQIIEGLKTLQRAGVTELANYLDMSKSGVHNHLQTLHALEYVTRDGNTFQLGQRFLEIGERTRTSIPLYRFGRSIIDNLARTCGGLAGALIEENGDGVYIYTKSGREKTGDPPVWDGFRVPLHATAGGKAILAGLPDDTRQSIVESNELEAITEHTATTRSELRNELQVIRERGVAYENQEYESDRHAVAVPVSDPDDAVAGAICVTATTSETSGRTLEEEVSGQVISAGKELERELLESAE